VRAAANVGLAALAITDHDTLSALAVARPEADRLGVELVGGVELTAEQSGREIHLLGYFLRDDDPPLTAAVDRLRWARAERIEAMVGRLADLGLDVDLAALRRVFPRATIGRRHLADWLTRSGQVPDRRVAFARFLGDGGPASVPKPRLPWAEAIALVQGAGGVAGLAHPPYDLRDDDLRDLVDGGLGAIEVDAPGVPANQVRKRRQWAESLALVPTVGTDFHAPDRPGRWVGAARTPAPDLERLRARSGT